MAQFEAKYREVLQSVTGQREKAPDIGFLPQIAPEPVEPLRGADPNNRPAQPTGGPGPSKERISRINSLPSFSTSFAGREREIAGCTEGLREHRWMTLTGMGGIGKTRLAVELGRRLGDAFEDGVLFVELVHAGNSEQAVLSALTSALKESGLEVEGDSEKAVIVALKSRDLLLIMDNFEAVMNGALVLQQCPRLRLLVTSQKALEMSSEGEHE
jgi:hypothetical protein